MATATPRYIVKKIGDQYVTIRQEEIDPATTTLFAIGGLYTAFWGLKRRSFVGLGAIGLGACLVYRGLTGRSLIERVTGGASLGGKGHTSGHSPSFQHDYQTESRQTPADEVDEMSMESFPASDAPARHSSTAS